MPKKSKVKLLEAQISSLQNENKRIHKQMIEKSLQMIRLLDVTKAINSNAHTSDLFRMYKEFLDWDLGVKRVALLLPRQRQDNPAGVEWYNVGASESASEVVFTTELEEFIDITDLPKGKHLFFDEFEQIIPVKHKDSAIAYSFIGGLERDEELKSKIQWIRTITNIIAVAFENKRLFKRQLEQERLNHEIRLAEDMQRKLVPEHLPQNENFEVSSVYKPHSGISGDFFDCFRYYKNRYWFCIADVSGKGLAAALLMSNFQAQLHTLVRKSPSIESFIKDLNEAMVRITNMDKYITFFIAEYDCDTHCLRYINAGHTPPLLWRKGGKEVEYLKKGCTILGYLPKLPRMEIGELYLHEEALLVMFTDGVTDTKNPEGDFFEEVLLADFAQHYAYLSPADFNTTLMQHIERFKNTESFPDDITLLTCKFTPS